MTAGLANAKRCAVVHACVPTDDRGLRAISDFFNRNGREIVHVTAASIVAVLPAIEALICSDVPRIDWSAASRLRLLQLMSSGTDTLWPVAHLPAAVAVANARGIHLPEMRDHVLAMLFAFARELPRLIEQQRESRWAPFAATSLDGKTVAILGLGEVGRSVAKACSGLGMRVVGVRTDPKPTPHVDEVHGPEAIERLLPECDALVVLLPLTRVTRGLLGATALAKLKPGAVLVDASRGGIVDVAALATALREGRLRAAAVDVFEQEPLLPESPLWTTPNLILTPHVAGYFHGYSKRAFTLFLENLDLVERGLPPRTAAHREREY